MLRRFSSNRFRLSDGFKSGEIVRLNSVQRRFRGCQARFRPSRASSVRLRLRSRGAFARPAFVRGGFPPPEVPGSFSRSRLLFRFVAVQLVHVRYLDGSFKFKIGCSICRSPLDPPRSPGAAVSVGSARFPPTGRPVRSGLARWFRLYQFSSFRSVRSLLVPVLLPFRSLSVPFIPACLFSFSRLVPLARLSCSFFWFRLVRFRQVLIPFRSVRFLVLLSLSCARAFSRAGFIYIILAYIIH